MITNETRKKLKRYKGVYVFLIPAVVSVLLFNYRPMMGILMAFQDFDIKLGYFGSPFVGLKHFYTFLNNPAFYRALTNTVGIGTISFVLSFPVPIVFALLLNELRWTKVKRVTQTVSYLPHFISWIVVSTMVVRLLDNDTGVVNNIMVMFGGDRIPFMRVGKYFWAIVIIAHIWKETGWNSIIYLAALSSIDQEMYEASKIDGAGRLKTLWYITLPSIAPTVALLMVLDVGMLVNAGGLFDAIYNLQNPLIAESAYTLEVYSYFEGILYKRYSYAAAITVTQSLIALTMVLLSNTVYKKATGNSVF